MIYLPICLIVSLDKQLISIKSNSDNLNTVERRMSPSGSFNREENGSNVND